jgi:hypothetical protein
MQNINSVAGLKNAIQFKEVEQSVKGQLLKEQFFITVESLKPSNLIKGTIKDLASSPKLYDNILSVAVGLATEYLSKKLVIGFSGGIVRKIMGTIMQLGVAGVVTKNPGVVMAFGQYLFRHIFDRKQLKSKEK